MVAGMVGQRLEVIDSDGHVLEPADLWSGSYMPAAYRDQGPTISLTDGCLYYPDGREVGRPHHSYSASAMLGFDRVEGSSPRFGDARPGAFSADGRIEDLDLDGIDAAFLYPTIGTTCIPFVEDAGLACAMARAYNTWLAEWTQSHPDRLFGVALLPVQSVEHAIEELRFARNQLGFKAAFLRPNMYKGRTVHSPEWDPFWAEAQELDCPIGFHGSGTWIAPQAGEDRFENDEVGTRHVVIHPFEQQLALVGLMQAKVFERFPKLRVAFLESGGGWIVPLLERLERHYDQEVDAWKDNGKIAARPREYFDTNCWISFEPVEKSLGLVADYIGPNKILWATDYPHSDGFFPGAPKMLEDCLEGCSEETKRGVLGGGARAFYNI
jgi:uncharacterized protein